MNAADPRFTLPDLTAEQLAELMGLTVWQVEERCRKGVFIFHWRGNGRGRRFTPEDVEHNRHVGASRGSMSPAAKALPPRLLKGAAKLREISAQASRAS